MKILVIDNYDSFTYNLVQLVGSLGCKVVVKLNDEIKIEGIKKICPDKIIISPGPGRPEHSRISLDTIKNFAGEIPILGVCLGHQAIAYCYGGIITTAPKLMHGKTSKIFHTENSVFKNIQQNFEAMRYHSLIVDRQSLPNVLKVIAESDDGVIMGLKHSNYSLTGIQFHPESILTKVGKDIIRNWLNE